MLKNIAIVGAMTTVALPATADTNTFPCDTFVIERVIDGDTYTSAPSASLMIEVEAYNNFEDVIRVAGRYYQEVRVRLENSQIVCVGIPLVSTDQPGSWYHGRRTKSPA